MHFARTLGAALVALAAAGGQATAADLALVIGVGAQSNAAIPDLPEAADLADRRDAYRNAGFSLIRVRNPGASGIDQALAEVSRRAEDADRILVVLAGRFVHSDRESWLLPLGLDDLKPEVVSDEGLPLSVVMAYLASRPGEAVLAIATDDRSFDAGPWLSPGLGQVEAAQGVTVLTGSPRAISRIVEGAVLDEGARLDDRVAADGEVRATGFLPAGYSFLGGTGAAAAPDTSPAEDSYWRATQSIDTQAGYESYLSAYPNGRYAADARAAIQAIREAPIETARNAEAALNLSRADRQQIQRDLTILEFDTRGIDGIFGRGTRSAIERWQDAQGLTRTGYLDREQVRRLANLADDKAAELEAEAETRRREIAADDQAFWDETGSGQSEDGLRRYLERFPDGLYADLAETRLQTIEEDKRRQAAATERQAWDAARATDTVGAYRDYLGSYPEGTFTAEARSRIAALQGGPQSVTDADALAAEQALGLSTITRRAIEERLAALDYEPGTVDGNFDDNTRRALRRYQAERELPSSGYLDEATVVRILADSVRSIFR